MTSPDWSRLTIDHAMGSDWSMGSVHVMGILLLVSTGEGLHD